MGATGGIGSTVCEQLAAQPNAPKLHLVARQEEALKQQAEKLSASYTACDITSVEAVDELFKSVSAECTEDGAPLEGVVHCVGSILLKPAHITKPAEWDETILKNLTSAFYTVRAATKVMQKTGGSIVLCASAAGRIGLPNHDAIGAAKAGVIGLTLSSAATYAKKGIRINCVAPGMVETPLSEPLLKNEAARQASEQLHPLGRIGQPNEVASAITWLLSSDQSWLTGQVIGLDGGLATLKT
jgi:NAD(P)-dependent dehydrogenase (short-subunit alcohol dehydrogenase family)